LELYPTINKKGEKINIPTGIGLDGFSDFIKDNSAETTSVIDQNKICELVNDIEFFHKEIKA